jgi:pimeloyl-ACP methyl ester carboxylesterase
MTTVAEHAAQLAEVEQAFRSLPQRYLGGGAAGYRIRLGDLGRIWEVRADAHAARVTNGTTRREPDVTFSTDAETWLALRRGDFSGIDAFNAGRLQVSGHLDHAIAFEGLFRLPNGRPPLLRIRDVPAGRERISTLTMGDGQCKSDAHRNSDVRSNGDVLLLHGLGATRASMLSLAARLSHHHRVHAIDLPGFGSSSKPARGRYSAPWFAEIVLRLMDELELEQAHLVGNSMGGRIAIEIGLTHPERVRSLGLLSPAVAWIRRDFHRIVRLLRPEFGFLPHGFTRKRVSGTFWGMFNDLDAVDPELADLIVDEFLRIYHAPGARHAFLASARNIYLDDPLGRRGFYPRLATLQPPALFVWGGCDPLVPAAFARHVAKWLPRAEQVTLEGCGHVPQVERPEETLGLLRSFITRADLRCARLESADDAPARSRRQSAA